MEISRRTKFSNRGKSVINTNKKSPIVFDISSLNLFCSYCLSENRLIRKSHLLNLRNLMLTIDTDLYQNDEEKLRKIKFIIKVLEGRLVANISNRELLIKYVSGGIMQLDIDLSNIAELNSAELDWINETISSALKNSFLYPYLDPLLDLITRIKSTEYRYQAPLIAEFEEMIDQIKNAFRSTKVESLTDMTFSLKDGKYEEVVKDVWEQIMSPSRRLYTGMQGLNQMTGGFESGRVYMLLGMTGVGKSLTLLNLMYQMKKYNAQYKPKDPTKTPVVVLLTMENTVVETITRLFQMSTGKDMRTVSQDDAVRMMKEDGELYITGDSPIDIVVKYRPNNSCDTGYFYTLTEELEDEGYEVVALFQDHVKRIRSCFPQSDIRLELGEVVNEMKVYAQLKDIPVITCSHLNRSGAQTIDAAAQGNKTDLTRLLGKANIGESFLMLDNLDGGYIINVEYDREGRKHMVFSAIKTREQCDRTYIAQPFVDDNDIRMVEDYYFAQPVFKESLHIPSDMLTNDPRSVSAYSNIEILDDNDDIFSRMSSYSATSSSNPLMGEVKNTFIPNMIGTPIALDSEPKQLEEYNKQIEEQQIFNEGIIFFNEYEKVV